MTNQTYRAKKRLGQHFLINAQTIYDIVSYVDADKEDTIIEIGPGKGELTLPLADSGAELFAVEFDRDLAPLLEKSIIGFDNARVINMDFLKFKPEDHRLSSFILVGNLPYNITTPVLEWCVRYRRSIKVAVLMMQRELAARVCAGPGSRDWSPLAIFTQLYFDTKRVMEVGPEDFSPRPEVQSSVVLLTPLVDTERPDYAFLGIPSFFEDLVRASFKHRRKQLVNNLVPDFVPTTGEYYELIDQIDLYPTVRAEELTIEQFLKLTTAIQQSYLCVNSK